MEYTAGRGTTALGIVGTVLGSIGTAGVLGAGALNATGRTTNGACCVDAMSMPVSRFELEQEQRISQLESAVALRDANTYADQKLLAVYQYIDGKLEGINTKLCGVEVYQATNTATISCLGQQVAALQNVLGCITKTVVPNSAVCPGWGDVTVTPAAAAA